MAEVDRSTEDAGAPEQFARAPRQSVFLSAVVERFGGGAPSTHRVRDLSPDGMRIDQAAGLACGATVLVTVGALEAVGATVIWTKEGLAGLKFAETVDPDDARAKAAVTARPHHDAKSGSPTVGWIPQLKNPYARR